MKSKKGTRRVKLGIAGVDSGALVIIDPCYIDSQWQHEGRILGVKFWGKDAGGLRSELVKKGFEPVNLGAGGYAVRCTEEGANSINDEIARILKRHDKWELMIGEVTASSYDECFMVRTEGRDRGGQLNFAGGNPGMGVVFSSGVGDGVYDVYATIKDIPGWGERIVKVEIELIPEEK